MTGTLVFPRGNLAPEGSVVKSTAIDPSVVNADGIYREAEGLARVFVNEKDAMTALKQGRIQAGDVMVLAGIGPLGTGMEETYQVTSALKHLPHGKEIALLGPTLRFSGVSTGRVHQWPHRPGRDWRAGLIGKVAGWRCHHPHSHTDRKRNEGSVDFVGEKEGGVSRRRKAREIRGRAGLHAQGFGAASGAARGHARLVGGLAIGQRRDLGGMRL